MQGAITIALIQFLTNNPKLAWIVTVFIVGVFGILRYNSYRDLQTMPLQPEPLTLEQIIEKPEGSRSWVTIDSAQWDCQNIVFEYKDFGTVVSHTYATFTNT